MECQFDVFLSYNRLDVEAVRAIATALRARNLRVWFDEWELQPGLPWMAAAEKGLESSRALAFFAGPSGMGSWQDRELRQMLERHVYAGAPVIPVLLPAAAPDVELPGFLRQNTWIVFRHLDDAEALGRLCWGITGRRPEALSTAAAGPAAPAATAARPDEAALRALADYLRTGNVTYYVGARASHGGEGLLVPTSTIARRLLRELDALGPENEHVFAPLDVAGSYYGLRHGAIGLENKLAELMYARASAPPPVLVSLARLLRQVGGRPRGRGRRRQPQVVVTTNLDVLTERALLAAGAPFSRLVQHRSGGTITVNRYDHVLVAADGALQVGAAGAPATTVARDDPDGLDDVIARSGEREVRRADTGQADSLHAISLDELPEPILYKFQGSIDVPQSCAISTDQYLEFLSHTQTHRIVTSQLLELIGNTPALFVGYSVLDPDFRLLYHAILREKFRMTVDMDLRYAVQGPPEADGEDRQARLEAKLWGSLKTAALKQLGIAIIETPAEQFLDALGATVARGA